MSRNDLRQPLWLCVVAFILVLGGCRQGTKQTAEETSAPVQEQNQAVGDDNRDQARSAANPATEASTVQPGPKSAADGPATAEDRQLGEPRRKDGVAPQKNTPKPSIPPEVKPPENSDRISEMLDGLPPRTQALVAASSIMLWEYTVLLTFQLEADPKVLRSEGYQQALALERSARLEVTRCLDIPYGTGREHLRQAITAWERDGGNCTFLQLQDTLRRWIATYAQKEAYLRDRTDFSGSIAFMGELDRKELEGLSLNEEEVKGLLEREDVLRHEAARLARISAGPEDFGKRLLESLRRRCLTMSEDQWDALVLAYRDYVEIREQIAGLAARRPASN